MYLYWQTCEFTFKYSRLIDHIHYLRIITLHYRYSRSHYVILHMQFELFSQIDMVLYIDLRYHLRKILLVHYRSKQHYVIDHKISGLLSCQQSMNIDLHYHLRKTRMIHFLIILQCVIIHMQFEQFLKIKVHFYLKHHLYHTV